MNREEAKFVLSGYRPGHEDRDDPKFAEALSVVEKDRTLKDWLDEQMTFDRDVAEAINTLPVPKDLHGKILAGARVGASEKNRLNWFSTRNLLAAAAALALGLFVATSLMRDAGPADDDWQTAAVSALTEMKNGGPGLDLVSSDPVAIRSWVRDLDPSLGGSLPIPVEQVAAMGCKKVELEAGIVTIVCFEHDGTMFHLASYRIPDEGAFPAGTETVLQRNGRWLWASWSGDRFAHMLITGDGAIEGERLREVVRDFRA